MGRMMIVLPDELESKFRLKVLQQNGGKYGQMSEQITKLIEEWVSKKEKVES